MDIQTSQLSDFSPDQLIGLAISIGIGFLIGMERQFSKEAVEHQEQFAGIRTFTMVSMFGFIAASVAQVMGAWIFGLTLGCVFAFVIISYLRLSKTPGNSGATSEFALVITFVLGGMVFIEMILLALIIMVVMLLLLTFKPTLHLFVEKLKRQELLAIILFVVMSALVIPFLPSFNFGPYKLWNLKEIWKMVVLVTGTSLIGYMIAKFMGHRGTLLAGVVGGLVSSTSMSLTFSRKSTESKSADISFYYAMGVISACTIMFPRVLFEVYVVNAELALQLWIPIALISLAGFGSAVLIFKLHKGSPGHNGITLKNPLDLVTAIKFALLYAAVQWLVKYSGEQFGNSGTYIAGAISGITDVDAITLSMAKMSKAGGNSVLAINTILIATLSNTLVKFMIVIGVGSAVLRKTVFWGFLAMFLTGLSYFLIFSIF
ncbi:MgtC/SapB family protein [Daejeonella sp. H1SJ63]|uniref:MgtC/SapB family protein n=1 Tax=Daejeonella sp. H1SJ63 TaxID=3034145 RepID=UPI0023EB66C8|nr:MgtC/SapB family protein [Daejeonella sp. H1SJ63]